MGALLSRTVEIQISNRIKNITLSNPRTYFECGSCSNPPLAELGCDCSDIRHFQGSFPFWGVAGILVYESEFFTLAIYFSNPIDYNKFSMELGLELSTDKAHRGSLEKTYTRMAKGAYSSSFLEAKFDRVTVGNNQGVTRVRDGPYKVTATMSTSRNSILRVQLEEERGTSFSGGQEEPGQVSDVLRQRCRNL